MHRALGVSGRLTTSADPGTPEIHRVGQGRVIEARGESRAHRGEGSGAGFASVLSLSRSFRADPRLTRQGRAKPGGEGEVEGVPRAHGGEGSTSLFLSRGTYIGIYFCPSPQVGAGPGILRLSGSGRADLERRGGNQGPTCTMNTSHPSLPPLPPSPQLKNTLFKVADVVYDIIWWGEGRGWGTLLTTCVRTTYSRGPMSYMTLVFGKV